MRHPALTRFFAAFLAVVSAITLLSGGICIKKAADSRTKQNTYIERLSDKADEAALLSEEIDSMRAAYEDRDRRYDAMREQYEEDMLSYRRDLAMYTATEAGMKQGREQLEEGYAGLRMGWIQHDNAIKALEEAEAQFQPGYEQYLAGKEQLAEGQKKLEEAEALAAKLPDPALMRAALDATRAAEGPLSATVDSLSALLQNPPLDPQSGEVDRDALVSQMQNHLTTLSSQLSGVRDAMDGSYTPEELQSALAPAVAALNEQIEKLSDGAMTPEELLEDARARLPGEQEMPKTLAEALDRADETLSMLENLPEMRRQLDEAQRALAESEPMLLQAKSGFEEGRKQLDALQEMLILTEAQLIKGKAALEEKEQEQIETRSELDRRRAELEETSGELKRLGAEVEKYKDKKDRFSNLRYALLADGGIAGRTGKGTELIEAARAELDSQSDAAEKEYALRLAAALGMLLAAAAGILTVAAAFRDKQGWRLLAPAAMALALSAAAEGVSVAGERGLIYTVLFVGIFAAGVAALNIRKA